METIKLAKIAVYFAIILFLFFFVGCQSDSKEIYQKDYGEEWPFTVSSGKVGCRGIKEVVFESGGITYALNGKARGKDEKYRDLSEIWKENPRIPGTKISPSDIIQIGLKFCETN